MKKIIDHILCAFLAFLIFVPGQIARTVAASDGPIANAYPYTKTFIISAYYSPLPCQGRYATGSYAGDIRLNGSGVNSADGTPVYPGMVAAPKTYAFGTKMHIPGVGTVAIHDRGGAIVTAGMRGHAHDRLDIWMGYGDAGLQRALNWGKRTVDVTVYGITDSVLEQVSLPGYSETERNPADCSYEQQPSSSPVIAKNPYSNDFEIKLASLDDKFKIDLSDRFDDRSLGEGDSGADVKQLQRELQSLNFYKKEPNGEYDDFTVHAVYKFQQSQKIVAEADDAGAGYFGPKTRTRLNEILSSRNYTKTLIAQKTYENTGTMIASNENDEEPESVSEEIDDEESELLSMEMDFGLIHHDVRKLQEFLKEEGFYKSVLITDYFGPSTRDALIEFQIENGLISSRDQAGAGRVGPSTLRLINTLG